MFKVWCSGVHIPFGHVEYMVTVTFVHIMNRHWLIICLSLWFFYLSVSLLLTSWIFSAFHSNKTIINFKECPSFNQLSWKGHCLSENKQKKILQNNSAETRHN